MEMVGDCGNCFFLLRFESDSTSMAEEKINELEYELADIVAERPQEFMVGGETVCFYPVTLAKTFLLKKHIHNLSIDMDGLKRNQFVEALRLVSEKREECCKILSIYTAPNTYEDLYDRNRMGERRELLGRLDAENLASLLINVLVSSDKTEAMIQYLGIDKELERTKRIMAIKNKNGKNTVNVGGKTVFGSFIAQLMEMGFTDREVLYERGYTFLRLMLADRISSIYMTEEEMRELPTSQGGVMLDGNNPDSFGKVSSFFASRGINIKEK